LPKPQPVRKSDPVDVDVDVDEVDGNDGGNSDDPAMEAEG
jgi:hypothetical protein